MKDSGKRSRRGEPLYFLAAILLGWAAARTLTVIGFAPAQALAPAPDLAARHVAPSPGASSPEFGAQTSVETSPRKQLVTFAPPRSEDLVRAHEGPARPTTLRIEPPVAVRPHAWQHRADATPASDGVMPVDQTTSVAEPGTRQALRLGRGSRWSGDGWVLYRRGSGTQAAAGLFPSYGASQAGGVIRYALAPTSSRAPQAYLRASRAIDTAQSEGAAGLSLRPLPGVPARLLAEARVQRDGGRTRLRPAIAAISEVPPVRLPLGAQGELYAQAGYVGGTPATPFFDAQATIERALLGTGPAELRLGAGAWAGGQKGSARLDVGPRASVKLSLGEASSRLALDWRFRVAGNARPGSGPAVTFSAGF